MQLIRRALRHAKTDSVLLGGRIRLYRQLRGCPLAELASALTVSRAELSACERGQRIVEAALIHRAALYLEVPVQDFFADLPARLGPQKFRP